MSDHPTRLQLSCAKGFNLQAHSMTINGLPAVNVARPGKWGNPYRIGTCLIADARSAVLAYRANLPTSANYSVLRGKNLACWCKPNDLCHGDVLLELANGTICEAVHDNIERAQ